MVTGIGEPVVAPVQVDRGGAGRRPGVADRCGRDGGRRRSQHAGGVPGPRPSTPSAGRECTVTGQRPVPSACPDHDLRSTPPRVGNGSGASRVSSSTRPQPTWSPARTASSTKAVPGSSTVAGEGVVGEPRVGPQGEPAGQHGAVAVGHATTAPSSGWPAGRWPRPGTSPPPSAAASSQSRRAGRRTSAGRRPGRRSAGEQARQSTGTPLVCRVARAVEQRSRSSRPPRSTGTRATPSVLVTAVLGHRGEHPVRADLQNVVTPSASRVVTRRRTGPPPGRAAPSTRGRGSRRVGEPAGQVGHHRHPRRVEGQRRREPRGTRPASAPSAASGTRG